MVSAGTYRTGDFSIAKNERIAITVVSGDAHTGWTGGYGGVSAGHGLALCD